MSSPSKPTKSAEESLTIARRQIMALCEYIERAEAICAGPVVDIRVARQLVASLRAIKDLERDQTVKLMQAMHALKLSEARK